MTGRLSLLLLGLAAYALLLFSSFAVAANHAPVAVGGGNDEVQDVPGAPLAGEETVDPASRRDITFADDAVGAVARSPWFGLASGLASIIALLVTLYSTQIRGLPFSMYRSLTWRRMLLFALGVGLLVVSGINFYFQWPPPGIGIFRWFYAWAHGRNLGFYWYSGGGTSVWALLFWLAVALVVIAFFYDPLARLREIVRVERIAILKTREREVARLFPGRSYGDLSSYQRRIYDDLMSYYSYLQARVLDALLGASPFQLPSYYPGMERLSTLFRRSAGKNGDPGEEGTDSRMTEQEGAGSCEGLDVGVED